LLSLSSLELGWVLLCLRDPPALSAVFPVMPPPLLAANFQVFWFFFFGDFFGYLLGLERAVPPLGCQLLPAARGTLCNPDIPGTMVMIKFHGLPVVTGSQEEGRPSPAPKGTQKKSPKKKKPKHLEIGGQERGWPSPGKTALRAGGSLKHSRTQPSSKDERESKENAAAQ